MALRGTRVEHYGCIVARRMASGALVARLLTGTPGVNVPFSAATGAGNGIGALSALRGLPGRPARTIALLAAFADGSKADTEREAIKNIAHSLGHEAGGAGMAQLYQDVLLKRVSMPSAVQALADPSHKQLAYEMAVGVCDADGVQTAAERAFLQRLGVALGIAAPSAAVKLGSEVAVPGTATTYTGLAVAGAAQ